MNRTKKIFGIFFRSVCPLVTTGSAFPRVRPDFLPLFQSFVRIQLRFTMLIFRRGRFRKIVPSSLNRDLDLSLPPFFSSPFASLNGRRVNETVEQNHISYILNLCESFPSLSVSFSSQQIIFIRYCSYNERTTISS